MQILQWLLSPSHFAESRQNASPLGSRGLEWCGSQLAVKLKFDIRKKCAMI